MRPVPVLVLALATALGLAFLLLRATPSDDEPLSPWEADPGGAEPPPDPAQAELDANPHLRIRTGNLMIRAHAPDGSVPDGTEVGYVHRGRLRLLYAGPDGRRLFADAPLGEVEIVARAPGYAETRSVRRLSAGVAAEVRLLLTPAAEPDEPSERR